MATRGAGSRGHVKCSIRRRLELGAGSLLLAAAVAAPAEAALPPAQPTLEQRASAARARLTQALSDAATPQPAAEPGAALAWWGNWHNWGWHPWWHNWPNWRNWHNWGNGPGAFSGCN